MNWSAATVADVPPAAVTVISTVPAAPAGEVAVICVALFTVYDVALVLPNFTAVAPLNAVPVITTEVPPLTVPEDGVIPVTVGTATYVNWSAVTVADVPVAVVTAISTVPAVPAGEVAVICVALLTVNDAALVLPNFTAVAPLRAVPVMTTDVPPVTGPEDGVIPVIVGSRNKYEAPAFVPAVEF